MGSLAAPRTFALLVGFTAAMSFIAVALAGLVAGGSAMDALILGTVLLGTGLAGIAAAWFTEASSRPRRMGARVVLAIAVATGIVALDVGVASWLMFLSAHDLSLLLVLLAYALAVTAGPALIMGTGVGRRLAAIERAAESLGAGDLAARMPGETTPDELGRVAAAFNQMAARLEDADHRRREVENARRDLFVAVSHDLRTPLASIRAMIEALSDGVVSDDANRDRYLHSITQEVQHLSLLIDDVFELAKLDSGELRLQMERVRMEHLVQEAIDSMRPQAERAGVLLAFQPGSDGPAVLGDPARLTSVLYNLVQNAIRHTPADGTITLRTRPVHLGIQVAVCDTGEGISPADLPHVFERFYRGEPSRSRETGGSGLGLAIARGIVEAHGGRIWAESFSQGATVTFELPAAG